MCAFLFCVSPQAGVEDETEDASDASASDTPSELLDEEDIYDESDDVSSATITATM